MNYNNLEKIDWISAFKDKYGHPPRVLHIGNIANNAYNNVKLLNETGLDCDVICYDYYHIMGCPEWEDADFEGNIDDQFFPDWSSIDLKGFERPKWFAQGPLRLCIKYLLAKHSGNAKKQDLYWKMLCHANKTARLRGIDYLSYFLAYYLPYLFLRIWQRLESLANRSMEDIIVGLKKRLKFLYNKYYILGNLATAFAFIILLPVVLFAKVAKIIIFFRKEPFFDEMVKHIENAFISIFPGRYDRLTSDDLSGFKSVLPLWSKLFYCYDIIQAYSTDPILPLLAGKPYFAFEHGTLREIPFQNNPQGRTTALSYHLAEHVFVTNSDCLTNARMLAYDRVSLINHPYDEDHGLKIEDWQELRQRLLNTLDAEYIFFFPTRHDWVSGTGYADKGNDIFLRAFCKLRKDGYRVGMVCCSWGMNIHESKDLLMVNGCSRYVHWETPMGIIKFERTAKACHIVVDQFKLGSFGGIVFKAMSIGVPVCSYLDKAKVSDHYAEMPPVVNCKTEEEVVNAMRRIIEKPDVLETLSAASRAWIKKYHSSKKTVEIQMSAYKKFVQKSMNRSFS